MWTLHLNDSALLTARTMCVLLRRAKAFGLVLAAPIVKADIARTGHYRSQRVHIYRAY